MADVSTAWPGIIIRAKATDSKKFPDLVKEALKKIDSKPVGRLLLQGIVSKYDKVKFGYTVCIQPTSSTKTGLIFKSRNYQAGSVTTTGNELEASEGGDGAISAIKWDPQHKNTPDGARPAFIALAHELLHAYHNLHGTSKIAGPASDKKQDEMMVCGLKGYEMMLISENRIRGEHGIAYRCSYHGKCDALEGTPDATVLAA